MSLGVVSLARSLAREGVQVQVRLCNLSSSVRTMSTKVPPLLLSNGVEMPMVGFGTAFFNDGLRRPELAYRAVRLALDAGYRHFDTAHMYGCEPHIGMVLAQEFASGRLRREDIFITTKSGHPPVRDFPNARTQWLYDPNLSAYDGVMGEFLTSLSDLGVGYADLLLLHWPGMFYFPDRFAKGFHFTAPSRDLARDKRAQMWRAAEELYSRGLVRAIGVSNFLPHHLDPLLSGCSVAPMMNQCEVHPYLQQLQLVKYCQERGIHMTAYCPLGGGALNVLDDVVVKALAEKKGVLPAQLVLAWLVQRNIAVIPKSSSPERMRKNLDIAQINLAQEEMELMGKLDRGSRVCADSSSIP